LLRGLDWLFFGRLPEIQQAISSAPGLAQRFILALAFFNL
jgi:hypothetical protein